MSEALNPERVEEKIPRLDSCRLKTPCSELVTLVITTLVSCNMLWSNTVARLPASLSVMLDISIAVMSTKE
jgi:hypothetical protein